MSPLGLIWIPLFVAFWFLYRIGYNQRATDIARRKLLGLPICRICSKEHETGAHRAMKK